MSGLRCKIILTERGKMIATAIALQDATKQAVMDRSTVMLAYAMYKAKDSMSEKEFSSAIFDYSAHLSALTASLVMEAVLTKSQLDEMMNTVKEMESMGKDITNE